MVLFYQCRFTCLHDVLQFKAIIVHNYNANTEKVFCPRTPETHTCNNSYGNLFASVIGADNARQNQTPPEQSLLVCLLKLSSRLIQTSLHRNNDDSPAMVVDQDPINESQTDENKAAANQQQSSQAQADMSGAAQQSAASSSISSTSSAFAKVPCVADNVLQHFPTMNRLLSTLAHSSSSSFVMLMSSMYPLSSIDANSSDPTTVADAVFQILMLLGRRATKSRLIIKPLFEHLRSSKSFLA